MTDVRRKRGTMKDPVAIGWKIERTSRDRIAAMAAAAGVSASEFVERMAVQTESELTDRGVPAWLPSKKSTEELPIDGT